MTGEQVESSNSVQSTLQPLLRLGIVGLLVVPGVSTFLTYERSVQFFSTLGLPAPGTLVLVVGALGLGIAALLLFDRFPRVAAVAAIPVMVVAAVTAGPTWQNLGVLLAAVVLVGIETESRGIPGMDATS